MIWLALFGALTVLDLLLTFFILGQGGGELNPVMGWAFRTGFWTAAAFKLLPLCCAACLWWLSVRVRLAATGLRLVTVILGAVVAYSMVGVVCVT